MIDPNDTIPCACPACERAVHATDTDGRCSGCRKAQCEPASGACSYREALAGTVCVGLGEYRHVAGDCVPSVNWGPGGHRHGWCGDPRCAPTTPLHRLAGR